MIAETTQADHRLGGLAGTDSQANEDHASGDQDR